MASLKMITGSGPTYSSSLEITRFGFDTNTGAVRPVYDLWFKNLIELEVMREVEGIESSTADGQPNMSIRNHHQYHVELVDTFGWEIAAMWKRAKF